MLTRFKRNLITSTDGTVIAYESYGDGFPLVFCNGVGCATYIWRYLRPQLIDGYRLIFWDYRGHGASGEPASPESVRISDVISDLEAVLADAGVDQAVFLGHSMGTQVIYEFAGLHPERVKAIVAICGDYEHILSTFGRSSAAESIFEPLVGVFKTVSPLTNLLWKRLLPTYVSYIIGGMSAFNPNLIDAEDFRPYFEHLSRVDPFLFFNMIRSLHEHSARKYLTGINAPALIIGGAEDNFTPPEASREAAAMLPQSELHIIPHGGHAAPLEQPQLIGLLVENFFLRTVFPKRAA